MNDRGESDGRVVPVSLSNKAVSAAAEVVEGRRPAKGNAASESRPGLSAGLGVSSDLDRVRQVARKDRDVRFTALLHHVTVERLEAAYRAIRPGAAPGVDGVTWRDYGQGLEENLRELHARVHRGAYRASPSRRVFIPKPDGRLRPLGVAALEDKIVQRAVVEVLNAVYEEDFLGFSYGFRPGRSPHDALDALFVGVTGGKVNWVLDGVNAKRGEAVGGRRPASSVRRCIGDGGAGRMAGDPPRSPCSGEAATTARCVRLRAVVLNVCGKVASMSAAGVGQEGERKRTIDDVSRNSSQIDIETGRAAERPG